jgi:hypothetical protein
MTAELRKLNEKGLSLFAEWIADGAPGAVPLTLMTDPETSDKLPVSIYPERHEFKDRLEFGAYLVDLLKGLDAPVISRDPGLWSALALLWFDLLCPPGKDGERKVDKEYRYILSGSFQTYYRHLVRTPWQLYRDHGEHARFMLVRPREVPHPLSIHGEILEQFGGRQRVMGSKPIIRAANRMYIDQSTGRPRKGVAGAGAGSALRFGKVVRQLDLTFDPELMSPDEFIAILPREFGKWRDALAADTELEAAE